jgi:hypothetical protein
MNLGRLENVLLGIHDDGSVSLHGGWYCSCENLCGERWLMLKLLGDVSKLIRRCQQAAFEVEEV